MAPKRSNAAPGAKPSGDYVPPTRGILSKLPASWVPYAELIRLEQPHGLYMTFFPQIIGLMFACSARPDAVPGSLLAQRLGLLFVWTFFIRSAGCAWNDNTDQDFDRLTERCRNRPIARGAVSTAQGHIYTLVLTLLAFMTIRPLPLESTLCGIVTIVLTTIYPFGKRFTNFAQVILGSTLASTIPLSAYSVGLPALSGEYIVPTLCLTATILLLVVFYDTIYARQDTADDLKSGVKGMAVLFRNHIESLLAFLALSITGLLATAGTLLNMGTYFFAFSVVGLATGLFVMIALIRWHVLPSFAKYAGWFYAFAIANLLGGCIVEYLGRAPALFA
ncbi:UbiA prenyltransferase family-domain-containing protein [Thelonectria olida]|uniref:UbiA prenyltransferase family-domain-containing protein n=1 Tax=Thelonectria olida TaxID=1576542 RepID=A0A9P8WDW8_9HYPO|nr:UbiA prenyltransferase family-domain-containing protein [Thelonectria olida]